MVYLIHFTTRYKHARHYIGYAVSAATFKQRIAHHRSGSGARLMQVVTEAGIEWQVARTWPDGDRAKERSLKKQHKPSHFCPLCQAENRKRPR